MITIDKDGNWFYNGMEMFRKDIIKLFYDHLKRDETGMYFIELGNDLSVIEVEDVPYIVKTVYNRGTCIEILLNDQTMEKLDLSTLRVGAENVLYCFVKNGEFEARFSRAAYYQIAELIKYGDDKKSFYIPINNRNYYINNSCS